MNRAQLLNRIAATWEDFTSSYAGLPEAERLDPGVIGEWSVRDVITHVTTWEEETLMLLPRIMRGQRTPRYSSTYGSIDAFNDLMMQRKRDLSLQQVLEAQQATHARLLAFLDQVPEEQFASETRFRRRLRLDTYSHYPEHAEAIRTWRSRRR